MGGRRPRRAGASPVFSLLRIVAGVLMLFGAFGFVLVAYLSWSALLETDVGRRGGHYIQIVIASLLALHTVGVGGLIWVVQRLASPPGPRRAAATPAPSNFSPVA